jgi:hypothetical protein
MRIKYPFDMGGFYDNDAFLKRLEKSKGGVWRVARWLSDQGLGVKINALGKSPKVSDRYAYADAGDLEISQRVEVKQLTIDFTCRGDWQFPILLVCSKSSWDAASPKPFAYVHLNAQGTHASIVKGDTFERWGTIEKQQAGHPYPSSFYYEEPSNVKFIKLEASEALI